MPFTLLFLLLIFAGTSNASDQQSLTSPCPGLVSSYDVARFEQVLVVTDNDFSSVEDCQQLGGFYFESSPGEGLALDYSRLASIVDNIWRPAEEDVPNLLMDAILSWMQGLGLDEHAETLREFVSTYLPAQESVQLFFKVVIWLTLVAILLLVLYEFYRSGMVGFPRGRHETESDRPELQTRLQWESILPLPLREQISALLQFSISRLAAAKLIPESTSFTNHELLAYLTRTNADKVPLLREQIELTEPVVYGDEPVSEEVVAACRARARELSGA